MLLGINQNTTGTTAVVFDTSLSPVGSGNVRLTRLTPGPGRVEIDPETLLENVKAAIRRALADGDVDPEEIDAVGLANQGETAMCWDGDGRPLHDALVWQDRRTADRCEQLSADESFERYVRETTGLRIDPYFSATKLEWLLDRVETPGEAYIGTTDTWLLWQLVAGDPYVTDPATASRTMLFDIRELAWDDRLVRTFGLEGRRLPEIRQMDDVVGPVAEDALGEVDAPVAGCIVDQSAALYSQGCRDPGDLKCTYGTGSFLLMNAGERPVEYSSGILGTVGWTVDGETTYAYDGGVYTTGAFVDWLVNSLELVDSPAETEALAREVETTNGVYAIPALTGLAAPYWDSDARGGFVGLDSSTVRAHVVRAALEGIAHRVRDVVDAMERAVGTEMGTLRVDGGLTANEFLLEYQAAVLGRSISVSAVPEATALGTAALAGRAVGLPVETDRLRADRPTVTPGEFDDVDARYEEWRDALEALRNWHRTR